MSKKKWTYEACYEEAKKYKTRGEFRNSNMAAYTATRKYGWLDKFTWFEPPKTSLKWTKETCYEVAKTCKTQQEMKKKNPSAYNAAWKNSWLREYDWFVDGNKLAGQKKRKYSYEECRKTAKQCKTLKEFQTIYRGYYKAAWKYDWLDEFTWLETSKPKWNVDVYAYIFAEQKTVYVGLTNDKVRRNKEHHGIHKTSAVFRFTQKHNLMIPDMTILKSNIPADPEGRYWEDYYVKMYKADGWNVLNTAQTGAHGSLGTMNRKLTKKKCYELSLSCTTRGEFRKKHSTAYQKSLREGWLDEWEHFAPSKTGLKWTHDRIMEETKKYKKFEDFRIQSNNAYRAAWSRNLLTDIKAYYEKRA